MSRKYNMKNCGDCLERPAKYGSLCGRCKTKRYRKKNPIQSAYAALRYHAKGRGIFFNLTFEHFEKICLETNYHLKKGKGKKDLTIDRIDPALGYIDSNIQVMTNSANVKKAFTDGSHSYRESGRSNMKWKTGRTTWADLNDILDDIIKQAA